MDRLSVLFPFVGIVVGLGAADLAFSVHRAVRARSRWHALPAAWVALTLLFVALYWWVFADIAGEGAFSTLLAFAFHLVGPLLVLVCAAALPDDGGRHDLLAYYLSNRRHFFGLYTLLFAHGALDYGFNYGTWGRPQPWALLVFGAATALLVVTERPAVHAAVTAALLAVCVAGAATLPLVL